MKRHVALLLLLSLWVFFAVSEVGAVLAQSATDADWVRVSEDDLAIRIETDKLEAAIAKSNPKHWMTGMTLEPEVVYEAWCSQRPGGTNVLIEEIHGKPVKAGDSFSAAHIVGYFDDIKEMHELYKRYKGHTALSADASGWRLE